MCTCKYNRVSSEAAAASDLSAAHVHHVAFTNGSGGLAVVVVNDGEKEVRVQLQWQRWGLDLDVCGGCVTTIIW
jgi:hypothetical protein